MRKFLTFVTTALLLIAAALPVFAQEENLVERAQTATNFETLLAAAEAAGLADTLATGGPFTIFAPTDGAFQTLLAELGVTADELLADTELLTSVLTYHVVEGEVTAADLAEMITDEAPVLEVTTLNGAAITVELTAEGVPILNGGRASVFQPDVQATNGIIHIIDNVLLPPSGEEMDEEMMEEDMTEESMEDMEATEEAMDEEMMEESMDEEMMEEEMMEMGTIVDIAAADEQFSTLVAAVDAAGLVETLSGGEFTVFAPTNGAFETLLGELEMTAEDLLEDTELLTSVLTYHVVEGAVFSGDLPTLEDGAAEVETVNGATLTIGIDENGVAIINGGEATVQAADIEASNGVIHVIDNVLLPPMGDMMEEEMDEEMMDEEMMEMGTIVDIAAADEQFSTLVAAVDAAGLVETLSGGEFTVFAPTNGAFETLLGELEMTAEDLLEDTELLTSVLTYHVVEGAVFSGDLPTLEDGAAEVETVNGATLTIGIDENGVAIINGGEATVQAADIEASNGVIHVIDNVLVPPMGEMMDEEMMEEDMDGEMMEESMDEEMMEESMDEEMDEEMMEEDMEESMEATEEASS